ncbi:hypothetical protein [Acidiphilium rubrum]|uniref:hypothetical protein n=1 Tax=Acidiphilium rubrum TaxID=526 RepID=UPI001FEAB9FF|nr:hypothetical protein [Acidiphilium rubrum]
MGIEPVGIAPDLQKRVLQCFLGVRAVAQQPERDTEHGWRHRVIKSAQCERVPLGTPAKQGRKAVFRRHTSCTVAQMNETCAIEHLVGDYGRSGNPDASRTEICVYLITLVKIVSFYDLV